MILRIVIPLIALILLLGLFFLPRRYTAALAAGFVACIVGLLILAFIANEQAPPPGSRYVPAYVIDGEHVPAQMIPPQMVLPQTIPPQDQTP